MKVAITGATGVIGRSAVAALVAAGHEVRALARSEAKAAQLSSMGASPVRTSIGDPEGLHRLVDGADAVCNFVTAIPVGYAGVVPGAWRTNDRLRTEGSRRVVANPLTGRLGCARGGCATAASTPIQSRSRPYRLPPFSDTGLSRRAFFHSVTAACQSDG